MAQVVLLGTSMKFREPETIKLSDLDATTGGMKWEGRRESYNVEYVRPGAPPFIVQHAVTWWHNFRNGYWY